MFLKNEINKMSLNNDNAKKVKEDINNSVENNGGITVDTISNVPNAIERLIKNNFKKFAKIALNKTYSISHYSSAEPDIYDISLNFGFNPTEIFIEFTTSKSANVVNVISTTTHAENKNSLDRDNVMFHINKTSKGIKLIMIPQYSSATSMNIKNVIAIG